MALQENDLKKAHMLTEKKRKLANLFEFGEYHEISVGIELATLEKNETETLRIMERMLTNLESIGDFTKSPLYTHMKLKAIDEAYISKVRQDLIKGFQDEETYAYMKDSQQWRALMGLSEPTTDNRTVGEPE